MRVLIEKYADFISVKTETEGSSDKRVSIVKPGEYLSLNSSAYSYDKLRHLPKIFYIDSDE